MADTPEFIEVVDLLRAMLDAEYRRGQSDERHRIREMLGSDVAASSLMQVSSPAAAELGAFDFGTTESTEKKAKRPRAPAGAPEALVMRVLTERGGRGAAAIDIKAAAQTEVENMVSISGIRFVLDKGRSAGRFRNELGRWFLVAEEEN